MVFLANAFSRLREAAHKPLERNFRLCSCADVNSQGAEPMVKNIIIILVVVVVVIFALYYWGVIEFGEGAGDAVEPEIQLESGDGLGVE